jgi:hypothetical protein
MDRLVGRRVCGASDARVRLEAAGRGTKPGQLAANAPKRAGMRYCGLSAAVARCETKGSVPNE